MVRLILLGICVSFVPSVTAQSEQIHGHVVDVLGAVIPNASIFVRRNMPAEETANSPDTQIEMEPLRSRSLLEHTTS